MRMLALARAAYGIGDKGFIELLMGASFFFNIFFSRVRLFLSKHLFGIPLAESMAISVLVISISFIVVLISAL
jgi:hypothetical protein